MKIRKDVLDNFIKCTQEKKGYEKLKLRELQDNESYEVRQRNTNGIFISKELVVRSKHSILLSDITSEDETLTMETKDYVNDDNMNIYLPEQYVHCADDIHEIKINNRIIRREYCDHEGNVLKSEEFRYRDLNDERFKEPYFIHKEELIDEEQRFVTVTFKDINITITGVNDNAIAIYFGLDDNNYSYGVILDDAGVIDRVLIQFKNCLVTKSIVLDDEPMMGDENIIYDY